MLNNEVHCLFGEVLKTFGTKGELLLKITDAVLRNERKVEEPVFVEFDGLQVPFYFKIFELRGKRAKAIFENMESESFAEELVGKKIFTLQTGEVQKPEAGLSELVNSLVKDLKYGVLGTVSDVFEFPGNPCIEVETNGRKIMIPLNGTVKYEHAKKQIITEIPEGLLQL